MKTIKEVLMERDGMSSEDADTLITDAHEDFDVRLAEGDTDLNDFCYEWFGLEPDYLIEFMG